MHTNILLTILNAVYTWIVDFQYPWDTTTFTIGDYISYCCIVFCIAYFVWHIIFFLVKYFNRAYGVD